MAIRVQRHANVSKQATLLDGLYVIPLKWRVSGCGLNRFVHEGMNHISNVEVHLKTRSGNVNIQWYQNHKGVNIQYSNEDIIYCYEYLKEGQYSATPIFEG